MGLLRAGQPPPERNPEPELKAPVDPAAQKLHDWRLLNLIRAYGQEPIDMDDVELLGLIARGTADLHAACKALKNGCSLGQAVVIFT